MSMYQYNNSQRLRRDRDVENHAETDQIGNLKTTEATAKDWENDSITTFNDDYSDTVISTATTTVIKSGAGRIRQIRVLGGTLGNVTAYDNTAASGTVMVPTFTPDKGQVLIEDCKFTTGLTIVTAAATLVIVTWR